MDGVQHVEKGEVPGGHGVGGWNDPECSLGAGQVRGCLAGGNGLGNPILMKVNYDNGHFTEEKSVTFKNFAGQFAFLLWQTGTKTSTGEVGRRTLDSRVCSWDVAGQIRERYEVG